MRVLIDTNIFIELEGTAVLDKSYPELIRTLARIDCQVLIHPASLEDLQRDKDLTRKEINLSKVNKYEILGEPPECFDQFISKKINCNQPNDLTDCAILCAVYRDAVNFLITEDNGIHKRAKILGVDARVLYVQQALSSFAATFSETRIKLPNIEQLPVHQIREALETELFNSLRSGYSGYDKWFIEKCSQGGREAWIARNSAGGVAAICIFAVQRSEPLTDDHKALPGSSLKLCTFKVGQDVQGKKIGELFLKAAFQYARHQQIENIFLEVKKNEQPHLESLLEDFGFSIFGEKGAEFVLVKSHPTKPPIRNNISPLEYHKKYWPHIVAGQEIKKFIVPIRPEFHMQLFSDWEDESTKDQLKLDFKLTAPPAGNALKLAYLCHATISTITPGDILLFYRSHDYQRITTIGIVETVDRLSDANEILKRVLKRTVYSAAQIATIASRETLVLLFRRTLHLPKPVTRKFLEANGIKGNIQSIRQINNNAFGEIVKAASIQDCLLAN